MLCLLTVLAAIFHQLFSTIAIAWLSKWSGDRNANEPKIQFWYLGIYGIIGVVQCI